jgi:hypothetical protein
MLSRCCRKLLYFNISQEYECIEACNLCILPNTFLWMPFDSTFRSDITNMVTSYNMSFIPLLSSHDECRKGKIQSNTRNSNKKHSDSNLCFIIIIYSLCTFYKEQIGLVKHRAICLSLQVHLLNQQRDFHKLDMNYVGGHQNFILFTFLQSVITIIQQTYEFMKLEFH